MNNRLTTLHLVTMHMCNNHKCHVLDQSQEDGQNHKTALNETSHSNN